MTNNLNATTSLVKDGSKATLVCPTCHFAKAVSVRQFRDKQHRVKIKCKCGHSFKVELEFRRHRRKNTDLPGKSTFDVSVTSGKNIKIVNLSLSGACFEVRGKHNLQIGQKGSINFKLDDYKQTVIIKNATVRSIQGNRIGCEFIEDRAYQKELGFFLRP